MCTCFSRVGDWNVIGMGYSGISLGSFATNIAPPTSVIGATAHAQLLYRRAHSGQSS